MSKLKMRHLLLVLPAAVAGCSSVTNLTPTLMPREAQGFYHVEAMWRPGDRDIRTNSYQPSVLVNYQSYPMHPEPMVKDRWEAYIPIPADKSTITYNIKFDFMQKGLGKDKVNSILSPTYELSIK